MLGALRARLFRLTLVLFVVSLFTMALVDLMPGDAAYTLIGETATPEQVEAVHARLGLDKPFPVRYVDWVSGAATGDLGRSIRTSQPVMDAIVERLPVTAQLAVMAVSMALLMIIPLGMIAAYFEGTWGDRAANLVASMAIASPAFLAAVVLLFFFAVQLAWFPVSGWVPLSEDVPANLRHAFLPALSLALMDVAYLRLLRSDMISTLQENYILAARAKGMPTWHILLRHAMRPSSFSLMTVSGISLGRLLGGTVIVEIIFGLPGVGQYLIQGIYNKDIVVIQGTVLFIATVYVAMNTFVELGYTMLDPRIRVSGATR